MKIQTSMNLKQYLVRNCEAPGMAARALGAYFATIATFACANASRAAANSEDKIIMPARKQTVLLIVAILTALFAGLQGRAQAQQTKGAVLHALRSPMVHLTVNQVAHLHFSGIWESDNQQLPIRDEQQTPIPVQFRFLDSNGATLLEPEATTVLPGQTISLDLFGDDLQFPPGSTQVGIRAVVDILDPVAQGVATLEVEDNATSSRFVLFLPKAIFFAPDPGPWASYLGPVSLKNTETALLTVVHEPYSSSNVRLMFTQGWSRRWGEVSKPAANIIIEKLVTLGSAQSATLSLSSFEGGVIFGAFKWETGFGIGSIETATLEVFDTATGDKRTIISWPPVQGGGPTGTGGGGY